MSLKFKEFVKKKTPIMIGGIGASSKKLHESVEEINKVLTKHYKFKKEHAEAVHDYTRDSYNLNKELWDAAKNNRTPKIDKVDEKMHNHLLDAIRNHTTPNELTVHTGLKKNPKLYLDKNRESTHFSFPAYTSASLKSEIAKNFAKTINEPRSKVSRNHVLSIHVPAGAHGVYANHHSKNNDEYEFILHPNAIVKIHHKPILKDNTYHWHGELVHDGVKQHKEIS